MAYIVETDDFDCTENHHHHVTLTTLEGRVTALEEALALKVAQADYDAQVIVTSAAIVTADTKRARDIKAVGNRMTAVVNKYLLPKKEA